MLLMSNFVSGCGFSVILASFFYSGFLVGDGSWTFEICFWDVLRLSTVGTFGAGTLEIGFLDVLRLPTLETFGAGALTVDGYDNILEIKSSMPDDSDFSYSFWEILVWATILISSHCFF